MAAVRSADIMNIDHVTFRTGDLEATRSFLETVLGVKVGYRPPFSFPGYWLYEGADPVIHLIPGSGSIPARDVEVVDHAGFRMDDYEGTREKLDRLGIRYQTMDIPDLHERRLFLHTPGGILMELVFRSRPDEGSAMSPP